MHVIVIQLACWRVGGERAALARARLRATPAASVLIVGEGAPPADLLEECAERRTLCVNSPLHAMQGRRLPDVRRSGDAEQLGWSLAVMAALRALQQDVHLDCVEIPSCGALAYALLQERALSEVFDTTRVILRFDGIQAIEVLRQGRNVEMAALMLMDMERMCLEQCDQVLVDSQAIAESLQRFLPGSQRPLHLQATLLESAGLVSEQHAVGSALACVATEAPALRQCLRAISGYLQQSNDGLLQVSVVCQPALLSEVLHVVPAALRHRFQEAPADCLRASPMRVVMPDRWSAGSALARELLAHGHSLIVDVANPALAAAQGWEQGRTHLGYTDARGLFEALRASQQWVPTRHLRMGPSRRCPSLTLVRWAQPRSPWSCPATTWAAGCRRPCATYSSFHGAIWRSSLLTMDRRIPARCSSSKSWKQAPPLACAWSVLSSTRDCLLPGMPALPQRRVSSPCAWTRMIWCRQSLFRLLYEHCSDSLRTTSLFLAAPISSVTILRMM